MGFDSGTMGSDSGATYIDSGAMRFDNGVICLGHELQYHTTINVR